MAQFFRNVLVDFQAICNVFLHRCAEELRILRHKPCVTVQRPEVDL